MVVFDPTIFPQLGALRRLQIITLKTGQRLNVLNVLSSKPDHLMQPEANDLTFEPLNLSVPEEVLAPILKLNTSDSLQSAIGTFFAQRFMELQLKCTTNYQQTCRSVAHTTQPTRNRRLQEAYLNFYHRQCHVLVEAQLPYLLKELSTLENSSQRHGVTKSEFNHEYTPVLESYFAYNAYPSLPDRLLLARKSMMTPRQIEVWFQNHRNRAKKDGVTLRRISAHTASAFAFAQHIAHAPQVVNSRRCLSTTSDIGSSEDDTPSEDCEYNVFDGYRPPHAFPTPYIAKSASDPSSLGNRAFDLSSRDWIRLPEARAPQHSSMTVDDLAGLFAQMNIRGQAQPSRSAKSALKQRKWNSPVVVAPPTAPHPAVLNPGYSSPLPTSQTPASCTWQKPSLRSRKLTKSRLQAPYPSWTIPDASRRQKSPALSRRSPSSPLNNHGFGFSPRISLAYSASSNTTSTSTRSTSMSSLASETSVETPVEITPPDITMPNSIMTDYALADTQWNLNPLCELQYSSLLLSQDAFSDPPQGLHLPDFATIDLPPFMFFES